MGRKRAVLAGLALSFAAVASRQAHAQIGSDRYSSIVMESGTGAIISAANPDELRHPASLTKMMTLYMLFEALRDRRVSLDQPVPVSAHAASVEPSKLGVPPGGELTVEQAILALVTLSANDAASALGELLGGDEDRFAQMMTLRAHAIGMTHTVFENASGLPDPDQVTTARDMAILARHLVQDFPVEYRYFSTPNFVFHGRTIWNHDRMLQTYPGADGLKTGFVNASGHNLVTSAIRENTRLIGVVLGASTNAERDQHMSALLDHGFETEGVPVLFAHHDVPFRATRYVAAARSVEQPMLAAPHHGRVKIRLAAAMATLRQKVHGHMLSLVDASTRSRAPAAARAVEVAEAPAARHPHGKARTGRHH